MPLWPFQTVASKARSAPLGPGAINQLITNTEATDILLSAEHTHDGNHNALEVARAVGNFTDSGGYSLNGGQSRVTYNSNPATGRIVADLDTDYFPAHQDMVVLTNVRSSDIASKPCLVHHRVDANQLFLYARRLDSALGAGNDFGANNLAVDFAIFAPPFADTSAQLTPMFRAPSQSTLSPGESYAAMRPLIRNQALLHSNVTDEHTAAGLHSTVLIPRAWGVVTHTGGGSYTLDASHGLKTVTPTSTGQVEIETLEGWSSPQAGFCMGVDGEFLCINSTPTAAATFNVHIYRWDGGGNDWDVEDASFFFVVFGAP